MTWRESPYFIKVHTISLQFFPPTHFVKKFTSALQHKGYRLASITVDEADVKSIRHFTYEWARHCTVRGTKSFRHKRCSGRNEGILVMKTHKRTARMPGIHMKPRALLRCGVGLATGLVGAADMLSAIVPRLNWDILLGAWPIYERYGPQKLTVIVGFFLIMLSYGLIRGKRQAWVITEALLLLSFFLHILRGGSVLATLVAALLAILLVLRPVAATLLPGEQERAVVSSLTHLYGKNSISYFALSEEKAYFFASSGKAVISYVLEGNVAVVAGDPIGPENEIQAAIAEFISFCERQDWTVVFWQVRADLADIYRSFGLHLLKIGEDAIIYAQNFTLKGGAMANVRTSARRAEKEGVRVVFYRGQAQDVE